MIAFVFMARQLAEPAGIELGAPIHLPLDELELGDLSFDLSIGPWLRDGGMYRWLVAGNSVGDRGDQAPLSVIQSSTSLARVFRIMA
jgi:hypothetical protein